MKIPEKFNKPLSIRCDADYIDEIESHFTEYIAFVSELLDELISLGIVNDIDRTPIQSRATDCSTRVINILREYTYKERFKASDSFKLFIESYKNIFASESFYGKLIAGAAFFRFRVDEIAKTQRNEFALFHIPFKLRRKVNNQRFNAHGNPCLYCSDKLKIAWTEVKKPNRTHPAPPEEKKFFNSAVFKTSSAVSYLDFSLRNIAHFYKSIIATGQKDDIKALLEYLMVYPFIISLHTKIEYNRNETVAFHNEYVMPTFLMDLFLSDYGRRLIIKFFDLKSIRYSSVEETEYFSGYNYVFPAKYSETLKNEYCQELTRIFLAKDKFMYLYEDEIPSGITKISETEIASIEKEMLAKVL